jgi:hypothetical protein
MRRLYLYFLILVCAGILGGCAERKRIAGDRMLERMEKQQQEPGKTSEVETPSSFKEMQGNY